MTGSLQSSAVAVAPATLAGYQLYCVTFATPPKAATGTADASGVVTVTLPPATPFGCFVLNASGTQVASLFFTSSTDSSMTGETAALTADTELGTITVNEMIGVAQPTNAVPLATTPSGTACPLGTFNGTIGNTNPECGGGQARGSVFVGKDENGKYFVNQTYSPVNISGGGGAVVCGTANFLSVPGSAMYNGTTFAMTIHPYNTMAVTLTPSSDCSTAVWQMTGTDCSTCDDPSNPVVDCNNFGTTQCPSPNFTFTRQ